MDDHVI